MAWKLSPIFKKDTPQQLETSSTGPTIQMSNQDPDQETTQVLRECPVCLERLPWSQFPATASCPHRTCRACLHQYTRTEVMASRVAVCCPECPVPLLPADIETALDSPHLVALYQQFTLRGYLALEPGVRWCPQPDCGYAVIAAGCEYCNMLHCERPGCDTYFCFLCRQRWHPGGPCGGARGAGAWGTKDNDMKECPRCGAIIERNEGCNHMTCAMCKYEFCWLCLKEADPLHFLGSSACTFYGTAQLSRRRRILRQLLGFIRAPALFIFAILLTPVIIGLGVVAAVREARFLYGGASIARRITAVTSAICVGFLTNLLYAVITVFLAIFALFYMWVISCVNLCRICCCRAEYDHAREGNNAANLIPTGNLPV